MCGAFQRHFSDVSVFVATFGENLGRYLRERIPQ